MKLSKLTAEIKEIEGKLAYGSETIIWGDYCERMRQLTGVLPYSDDAVANAGDPEIADDECRWWLDAYALLTSDNTIGMDDIIAKLS